MQATKKQPCERRPEDSPVAWFAVLQVAKEANDFCRAAEAQRELARLGVTVRFASGRKAVALAGH
ncbi:MAG TPA: hypothetical protein VIL86_03220 [Tepidisphaeraceae bacterium]|jgi:hypothetical protein